MDLLSILLEEQPRYELQQTVEGINDQRTQEYLRESAAKAAKRRAPKTLGELTEQHRIDSQAYAEASKDEQRAMRKEARTGKLGAIMQWLSNVPCTVLAHVIGFKSRPDYNSLTKYAIQNVHTVFIPVMENERTGAPKTITQYVYEDQVRMGMDKNDKVWARVDVRERRKVEQLKDENDKPVFSRMSKDTGYLIHVGWMWDGQDWVQDVRFEPKLMTGSTQVVYDRMRLCELHAYVTLVMQDLKLEGTKAEEELDPFVSAMWRQHATLQAKAEPVAQAQEAAHVGVEGYEFSPEMLAKSKLIKERLARGEQSEGEVERAIESDVQTQVNAMHNKDAHQRPRHPWESETEYAYALGKLPLNMIQRTRSACSDAILQLEEKIRENAQMMRTEDNKIVLDMLLEELQASQHRASVRYKELQEVERKIGAGELKREVEVSPAA